jgi:hypothetical protein
MAYIELLLFFIYAYINDTIYQSLARVKVDGGVTFYGVTSIGNPPQAVVTQFEFNSKFTRFRNYPNNQAFNDDFMHDDVFGDVNLVKVANQKFSLPFLFDPYYPAWVKAGDIPCQLSVGMGVGSPIWNRFANISYGHLGMTFNEYSLLSKRAFDGALQCQFNSSSLCDIDADIRISPSNTLIATHVAVRIGLDNTPVTYMPNDIFYAIKGTLTPKLSDVGDWPNVKICDQGGQCFTLPNSNIIMREGSFNELTLRPWSNDYILLGTSVVENVQLYFFSRHNKMGVYEHPTVLAISSISLITSLLSAIILGYIATTSYNINAGIQKQIKGLEFRFVLDFLLLPILPALMFSNSDYSTMLYEQSLPMFLFILFTYAALLLTMIIGYSELITGYWQVVPTTFKERVDKAGTAMLRNLTACTAAFFNIFCVFLQTYPGGDIETFQFTFILLYGIFTFFLLLNTLWFLNQMRNAKWIGIAVLVLFIFATSTVAGSLSIITPYVTNNFGSNVVYRNLILLALMVITLFISLVGAVFLSAPYIFYIRTANIPALKEE